MEYKLSNYIYVLTDESLGILFNGVTKKFLCVNKEELSKWVLLLNNYSYNDDDDCKRNSYLQKFKDAGFLLPENVDEKLLVKETEEQYIKTSRYQTILIPTYNCNYSCWYCIQKHHSTIFTKYDMDKIEKHIVSYMLQNKISGYDLCWFGGEPLMQKDIVVEMSAFLSDWCRKNHIPFNGQMTTNGALLTEELIGQLRDCNINHYQITLDGDREHHNRTKREKGNESSFDVILNNLRCLLQLNRQATVVLRLNYNNEKLNELGLVKELNAILPATLRNRIFVDLQRIWQSADESVDTQKLYHFLEEFSKNGYRLSTSGFFRPCYVEKQHFETIYYNGKIDFCDNYAADKARGVITDAGTVKWETIPQARLIRSKSGKECEECVYSPVCTGECLANRDKRLKKNEQFKCPNNMKKELEIKILDYCFRNMLNAKYCEK